MIFLSVLFLDNKTYALNASPIQSCSANAQWSRDAMLSWITNNKPGGVNVNDYSWVMYRDLTNNTRTFLYAQYNVNQINPILFGQKYSPSDYVMVTRTPPDIDKLNFGATFMDNSTTVSPNWSITNGGTTLIAGPDVTPSPRYCYIETSQVHYVMSGDSEMYGLLGWDATPIYIETQPLGNIHLKGDVSGQIVALTGSQVSEKDVTFEFDFTSGDGSAYVNYALTSDPNVSYYSIDGYEIHVNSINGIKTYDIQINYEYDNTVSSKTIYMRTTNTDNMTKTITLDVDLGSIGTTTFENDGTNPELYVDPVPQVPDIGEACSVQQDWPFFDFAACASSIKQTFELVLIDGQDLKSIAAGAPSGCYTLRVIDDWLFLPNQYVCPRFNDTIRGILTPFIILAFGLMGIRFLAHGINGRDY